MTTRRQLLAAAIAAPIVATPAMAQQLVCSTYDPIPEYQAAFHSYDEDNAASVARHWEGRNALYDWVPETAQDMLRKVVAILDEHGAAPETDLTLLIQQVDRLVIEAA